MEGLAALSLAATIVQLVDFSAKIFKESSEIFESGQSVTVADLYLVSDDLRSLTASLDRQLTRSVPAKSELTAEELAVVQLAHSCREVSQSLVSRLDNLTGDRKSKHQKWESFGKAVKTIWSKKHIQELSGRLDRYRDELSIRILVLLNAQQRRDGLALNALQEGQKEIVEIASFHLNSLHLTLDQASRIQVEHSELQEHNAERRHAEIIAAILTTKDGSCHAVGSPLLSHHSTSDSSDLNFKQMVTNYQKERLCDPENISTTSESLVQISSVKLRDFEKVVLSALHFREINERKGAIVQAHETTFEWVFDPPQRRQKPWAHFTHWLEEGNGCYWINGKAGSGKSTLMKFISTHPSFMAALSRWAWGGNLVVGSHFFWYAGTALQCSQIGLLRSLLYQLLSVRPGLVPMLFPDLCRSWISGQQQKPMELSMTELKKAFMRLIETDLHDAKVCFVVDGVDEYRGDHHELAELFSHATRSARMKVLLSSRPVPSCVYLFSDLPGLRLQDLTQEDVRRFATDKLSGHQIMKRLEAEQCGATAGLVESIVTKSWGVFLWVALVVKILIQGLEGYDTISDLNRRLDELPEDLQKLYTHMLASMEKSTRIQGSKLIQVFLRSSELHSIYPMTVLQLSYVLEDGPPMFQSIRPLDTSEEERRCQAMEGRLRSRCCGLIEVIDGGIIQFLHRTVAEFLSDPDNWADLTSLTRGEKFDVTDALIRSSCAEMEAHTQRGDSMQSGLLWTRALLRALVYGGADQHATEVCTTTYIPRIQQLIAARWKIWESSEDLSVQRDFVESLLLLAANSCPPTLFGAFLEVLCCFRDAFYPRLTERELRTLFAARVMVSSLQGSRTQMPSLKLIPLRNVTACGALPNLPIYRNWSRDSSPTYISYWSVAITEDGTIRGRWTFWDGMVYYMDDLSRYSKDSFQGELVNDGTLGCWLDLFLSMIKDGAEPSKSFLERRIPGSRSPILVITDFLKRCCSEPSFIPPTRGSLHGGDNTPTDPAKRAELVRKRTAIEDYMRTKKPVPLKEHRDPPVTPSSVHDERDDTSSVPSSGEKSLVGKHISAERDKFRGPRSWFSRAFRPSGSPQGPMT